MRKVLLFLFIFLSIVAGAQTTTTVTATIQYPDGSVFANGSVMATFTPPTGVIDQNLYLINGSTFPYIVTSTMNGSGLFTMTLTDDQKVRPQGGRWMFTLCSLATSQCINSLQDVSGTSVNLSSVLNATINNITGTPTAINRYYADTEVPTPGTGGFTYYNLTSNTYRCYNGSSWSNCATGTGGSGTVTNIATTGPLSGGPITVTGTLSCPTCAITTLGLNQFASTTSAQLFGVLSDSIGTGKAVFATALQGSDVNLLTSGTISGVTATPLCTDANGGATTTGCPSSGTGTVTNVATTGPISGGPFSTTGTISCPTCVTITSPSTGIGHFTGSSNLLTSSLIVQGDVTSGYVDLFNNQLAIAGTKIFTGSVFFTNINNKVMCDQFAGAFDAKINSCITAVIAQGGGIADATGLIGTQTHTTEIDVGNSGSTPVSLYLSPYLIDNVTMTQGAGFCAFKGFDGSRLIGTVVGTTHQAIIKNASASTSIDSLFCTNYAPNSGLYFTLQGLQFYNPGAPSNTNFLKGMVFIKNLFDTASIRDLVIANEGGDGLVVEASCCAALVYDVISDGNSAAGSRPVVIKSILGDLQPINALTFHNLSADHPGAGLNNVTIQNTYSSLLAPCSITFSGYLYMEGNSTDTTTPLMNNDSCTSVYIESATVQFRSVTSTAVPINVTHTSVPGINPVTTLGQGVIENSPQTFPATFLNDVASSIVVKTDTQGVAGYYGFPFTFIGQAHSGVGDTRFTPSSVAGFHIRVNVNNMNPLRLEDSTLNPEASDWGPNVNSSGFVGIRDSSGGNALLDMAFTTPFHVRFPKGIIELAEVVAPSGNAGNERCWGDSTAHMLKCIYNGGSAGFVNLASATSTTANFPLLTTTTAGLETPATISYPASTLQGALVYANTTTSLSSIQISANRIVKGNGASAPGNSSITDGATTGLTSTTNFFTGINTVRLTANATAITALTPGTTVISMGALPVSTNLSFHCHVLYNQQTAAVAGTGFAIQAATNAPTRLDAWGQMFTSSAGANVEGNVPNLATTTATPVVSGTPSAITTVFQAEIDGSIQSGASAPTLNLLAFTGNASDSITVQAGSYCSVSP